MRGFYNREIGQKLNKYLRQVWGKNVYRVGESAVGFGIRAEEPRVDVLLGAQESRVLVPDEERMAPRSSIQITEEMKEAALSPQPMWAKTRFSLGPVERDVPEGEPGRVEQERAERQAKIDELLDDAPPPRDFVAAVAEVLDRGGPDMAARVAQIAQELE